MKEQNNDILGGFLEAFDNLSPDNRHEEKEDKMIQDKPGVDESEIETIDPEELEKRMATDEDEIDEPIKKDEEEEIDEEEKEEEEEVEPIKEDEVTDIDEDDVTEEEIVDTFFSLFSKELGWETDKEESPKSVKELVGLMDNIVKDASVPKYYSEDVKKLDEFVRNGGSFKEFYTATKSGVNTDTIDLAKEGSQKTVLREYLKSMNYSDAYVDKKINRYDESGVLEEEAEDALELLKEYNKEKEQKLLKDQEKEYDARVKQQQKFVSDVQDTIESSDTILGIKLNAAQKRELTDYIFKVGPEGRTEHQKDYASGSKAFVETALLLKEKENIFKKVETKANTDAIKNLRKKIKNNKNKGKQQKAYESKQGGHFSMLSAINKQLSNT